MQWLFNCFPFLPGRSRCKNVSNCNGESASDNVFNESVGLKHSATASTELTIVSTEDRSSDDGSSLPERGKWAGKLDFMFGCISYAVGLGNVWRFPYLCYENGGGAFLIPFFISIVICGIPLFVLEVALGQYLSTGGIGIWNMIPIFKGIGYASMTMIGLCNIYYIVLIAWTLFYLVSSFTTGTLPWEECGNSWNTNKCLASGVNKSTAEIILGEFNLTLNDTVSPVKEYWERRVLEITSGLEIAGSVRMELCLYLLLAWFMVYIVIWRGIHQSGKIIWFTAIFPYIILFILFIRGVTLEGASKGLLFYITPKWEKLAEPTVWVSAVTQVLFSYGVGIGANVALGSYNKFRHNFYRDSIIVCCISSGTSIFSGLVIFSVLGHMAHVQDKSVGDVAQSGPGLAFLAYPEVVAQLPISPLWAILFFLMLLILGIDSQFCTVEAFVTGIVDEFASILRPHRKKFTAAVVFLQFILGIPLVTQGGMYLFQIMDFYSASGVTLLLVVFFEIIGLAYIYGYKNIYSHIEEMIGFKPSRYFYLCWVFGAPVVLVGTFLFSIICYQPLTYADDYVFPFWGELLGWGMSMASVLWIPSYFVFYLVTEPGTLKERLRAGLVSTAVPQKEERSPSVESQRYDFINSVSSSIPDNGILKIP